MNNFSARSSSSGRRPLPERNPITHKKHRHEVFWQITIPLMVGILLVLVFCVFVVFGASVDQTVRFSSISLIFLISQAMFVTFIFLIVTALSVYLLYRLLIVLPSYFRIAQDWLILFGLRVRGVTNRMVEPFLRVHATSASTRTLGRRLRIIK